MLFVVSDVALKPQAAEDAEPEAGLDVIVEKAGGTKCERCWRYVPEVSERRRSARVCASAASRRWPRR